MKHDDPGTARILVVEDDDHQRESLESVLACRGYRIETARNGLDAFAKVRDAHYDLLLVDYNMPDIDGIATARLVRDLRQEIDRPALIAFTGTPDKVAAREATHEPVFDSVLAKPANLAALTGSIDRELEAASRRAAQLQAEAVPPVAEKPDEADPDPSQRRILLVEDDPMQRYVLWHMLERYGYTVDSACDGFAAVRMTRETNYDLVLMDYQLPEMDGLATARLILGSLGGETRPRVVALTTTPGLLNEREASTGTAFDEVVAKVPDLPALLATVRRHMSYGSPTGEWVSDCRPSRRTWRASYAD